MHLATPEEVAAKAQTASFSPDVFARLIGMLSSGTTDLTDLADVLRGERALAIRAISAANSVAFGDKGACGTVDEAVSRLGFRFIYDLTMLAFGMEQRPHPLVSYGLDCQALWRRTIAGALIARRLAEAAGIAADQAYTLGLLHDVGMVAIDRWVRAKEPSLVFQRGAWPDEWVAAEKFILGIDHAAVSASLLLRWGFPRVCVEAVRHQYGPEAAPQDARELAQVLNGAVYLRRLLEEPYALRGRTDHGPLLPFTGDPLDLISEVLVETPRELERTWFMMSGGTRAVGAA